MNRKWQWTGVYGIQYFKKKQVSQRKSQKKKVGRKRESKMRNKRECKIKGGQFWNLG